MSKNLILVTGGGRIVCLRCLATSKRTGEQCRAPATKGKTVCRFHGGLSTGPRTPEGRQRCAKARTTHGRETRQARTSRSLGMQQLSNIELLGRKLKLIVGLKTPGRKPLRS